MYILLIGIIVLFSFSIFLLLKMSLMKRNFLEEEKAIKRYEKYWAEESEAADVFMRLVNRYYCVLKSDKNQAEGNVFISKNSFSNNLDFYAEILLTYKDSKTKTFVSEIHCISVNDISCRKSSLVDFIYREYNGKGNITRTRESTFKNFIRETNYLLGKDFQFTDFDIVYEDVIKVPFSLRDVLKEVKLEEKLTLKEKVESFTSDLESNMLTAKKLSSDIDDIDISISVSELCENTSVVIDYISRMRSLTKFEKLSKEYEESFVSVLKNLEKFKALKDSDSLSLENEEFLQNEIDKEIVICSKLAKF